MEEIDPTIFADVADALGIEEPILVEKDYYAVQLLKSLHSINDSGYSIVFAGGTCLSKAHIDTFRMSEDVDIKLIPSLDVQNETRGQQRKLRGHYHQKIYSLLDAHSIFELSEKSKRDEGKYLQCHIKYPRFHTTIDAIRPEILLEITESSLLDSTITAPIYSMYSKALKLPPEIPQCYCATIEVTASEKLVALLRRTAAYERNPSSKDDKTLVRHIYDLHLINQSNADKDKISKLIKKVIEIDINEFGNQHPQFRDDPYKELLYGFEQIQNQEKFRVRYQKFIGPLVYNRNPASWEESMASLNEIVTGLMKE
ncbi:nucleotidyl transferase AbiEii/AbiGii toxin family protein [Legionella sp. km535]|uniref:nucleotidyl transferase AbiEii/AbiGii toxin family protein n=1 Tax=Legionella sp. km535 TaxID=2498107 RepID=UPI001F3B203E|nr:nucleotidyl transferase AbiEii/AbiGii toxin family protein [Legionella sp. km535]